MFNMCSAFYHTQCVYYIYLMWIFGFFRFNCAYLAFYHFIFGFVLLDMHIFLLYFIILSINYFLTAVHSWPSIVQYNDDISVQVQYYRFICAFWPSSIIGHVSYSISTFGLLSYLVCIFGFNGCQCGNGLLMLYFWPNNVLLNLKASRRRDKLLKSIE